MTAGAACFDAATFQRLLAGQLDAAAVEAIGAHLEGCEQCVRLACSLSDHALTNAVQTIQGEQVMSLESARLYSLLVRIQELRSTVGTISPAAPENLTGGFPQAPAPAAAASFGRYQIVRQLGRGGMGTVYEAHDPQLHRRVALKVPQFAGSAEKQARGRLRFLREARAAAAVDHPGVCKIFDVGEHEGTPFVVMAYVEGGSLADRLMPGRRIKDATAVTLAVKIAEGLRAVHKHGIIHRDLKPGNILMSRDNLPVLTDFGLARVRDDSEHITGEEAILGTPAYLAPEQALRDLGPVSPRTDLYSLGVVLFQMLTGRQPVEGTPLQIVAHHLQRRPAPSAAKFRPGLDPELDAILRKAMAHRPEDRYPDVRAFSQALKDWLRLPSAQPGSGEAPPLATFVSEPVNLGQPLAVPVAEAAAAARPPVAETEALPRPAPRASWGLWLAAAILLLLVGGALGCLVLILVLARQPAAAPTTPADRERKEPVVPVEPPKPGPRVLVQEDFRKGAGTGRPPDGWEGDAFRVVEDDKQGRPALEVSKAHGESSIKVPLSAPLAADFRIDVEYVLGNSSRYHLTVTLESGTANPPLVAGIEGYGKITIADDQFQPQGSHRVAELARFRVSRTGRRVEVWHNNRVVAAKDFKDVSEYDSLRISLTAPDNQYVFNRCRVYSLKVETLGP